MLRRGNLKRQSKDVIKELINNSVHISKMRKSSLLSIKYVYLIKKPLLNFPQLYKISILYNCWYVALSVDLLLFLSYHTENRFASPWSISAMSNKKARLERLASYNVSYTALCSTLTSRVLEVSALRSSLDLSNKRRALLRYPLG